MIKQTTLLLLVFAASFIRGGFIAPQQLNGVFIRFALEGPLSSWVVNQDDGIILVHVQGCLVVETASNPNFSSNVSSIRIDKHLVYSGNTPQVVWQKAVAQILLQSYDVLRFPDQALGRALSIAAAKKIENHYAGSNIRFSVN